MNKTEQLPSELIDQAITNLNYTQPELAGMLWECMKMASAIEVREKYGRKENAN